MRRNLIPVFALILMAGAAAPVASAWDSPAGRQGPDRDLLVVTRDGSPALTIIDAATGELATPAEMTGATSAAGSLYQATTAGATTRLTDVTNPDRPAVSVQGTWQLPTIGLDPTPVGLSADGRTLVLVETSDVHRQGLTRFAIVSVSGGEGPKIVTLTGDLDFDAVSPDGQILYVVQHLATGADAYQVLSVDASTGAVLGVVADKRNLDEEMAGSPISQVRRPDGMVYTLYSSAEHPFIHTLDTQAQSAICIDLPAFGSHDQVASQDWGLAMRADGTALYAANASLGVVLEFSPSELVIKRTGVLSITKGADRPASTTSGYRAAGAGRRVVVTADGMILAAGSAGIVSIDGDDLSLMGSVLPGASVAALTEGPNPGTVYALLDDQGRLVLTDTTTGVIGHETPRDGFTGLIGAVGR